MMSERPSRGTRFASVSLTVVILCLGLIVSSLGAGAMLGAGFTVLGTALVLMR